VPLYSFLCRQGHTFERHLSLAEYEVMQLCECGSVGARQICAPMIAPDLQEYVSPVTGRPVRGRRERMEDLKRSNSRPYEVGEREAFLRRKEAADRELERSVERTVGEFVEQLPGKKREELGASLESNEAVIERR
jgi:hypothetical protein